jgi:RNA-binding protein
MTTKQPSAPAAPAPSEPSAALTLSQQERKALKAQAHHLDPVVMLGDAGLTDGVLAETDRSLDSHGLIKVRVGGENRQERQAIAQTMAEALHCAVVQQIGKLIVLWRPKPPESDSASRRKRSPRANFKKTLAAQAELIPKKAPARKLSGATKVTKKAPARKPR